MKYKELTTLKAADLEKKQKEVELELVKLRAQVATGTSPKSPGQIAQLKKIIARINTIRNIKKPMEVQEKDAGN
jgi:ribosomal protein L29